MSQPNAENVYLKLAESYDQELLDAAVAYILHNCSLDERVSSESRVVLKVNLLMKSNPDNAVTTNPAVVRAVINALKARNVKNIVIADSPGGLFSVGRLNSVYQGCGMSALVEDGVTLNLDLSAVTLHTQSAANPTFEVLKAVTDADLVIGIGKLKTHALTGITGAVKNYFGVVPGLMKPDYHFRYPKKNDFGNMLVDLYECLQPDISLLDAVVGMEGNGPSGGLPRQFGFVIGGNNAHYVDRVAVYLLGLDPSCSLTTQTAITRGLVPENLEDITIKGDFTMLANPLKDVKLPDSLNTDFSSHAPSFLRSATASVTHRLSPAPVIRKKDCIGCSLCAETCAADAININKKKKALIRDKKCIRCFCCHEVCPARAIDIKRNVIFRMMEK